MIRIGHIRLISGQTSNQNFISGNFYCTKSCILKFQGNPWESANVFAPKVYKDFQNEDDKFDFFFHKKCKCQIFPATPYLGQLSFPALSSFECHKIMLSFINNRSFDSKAKIKQFVLMILKIGKIVLYVSFICVLYMCPFLTSISSPPMIIVVTIPSDLVNRHIPSWRSLSF